MEKKITVYSSDWCEGCDEFVPELKKKWVPTDDDFCNLEEYIVCMYEKKCAHIAYNLIKKKEVLEKCLSES